MVAPGPSSLYHTGMTVDILCKVVDNFGDIGVVWRLAKALKSIQPHLNLRIIIDDLTVFAAIHPGVDPAAAYQADPIADIFRWDSPNSQLADHRANLIIETFACGRPDWYDTILHDPANPLQRLHISLEYLSAEAYAGEFHRLPSLSPIPQVKKVFFMPGFDQGTAGLIFDPGFMQSKTAWSLARGENKLAERRGIFLPRWFPGTPESTGPASFPSQSRIQTDLPDPGAFWLLVFSYEHNFANLLRDLAAWSKTRPAGAPPITVLVAAGSAAAGFFQAWNAAGRPFAAHALPFLCQEDWDDLLLAADFAIVRGEESLARAALGGRAFLWQAYLQAEGYQQVKAAALIKRLERHFSPRPAWFAWSELMTAFNERTSNSSTHLSSENYLPMLTQLDQLQAGFADFAESLEKLGDCAAALLSFADIMG